MDRFRIKVEDLLLFLSCFAIIVVSLSSTLTVLIATTLLYITTIAFLRRKIKLVSIFDKIKPFRIYFYFLILGGASYFYAFKSSFVLLELIRIINAFLILFLLLNYFQYSKNVDKILKYLLINIIFLFTFNLINFQYSREFEFGGVNPIGVLAYYGVYIIFYFLLRNKFIYLLYAPLILFTLISTASQKSIISLILSFLFFIILTSLKQKLNRTLKFIFFSSLLILSTFYLIKLNPRLSYAVDRTSATISSIIYRTEIEGAAGGIQADSFRAFLINRGLEYFNHKPFFGYGLNNSRPLFQKDIGVATYTHNTPVELLVTLGLTGFLLYYLFIFLVLKEGFSHYKISNDRIVLPILSALIGMLFMSYFQKMFSDMPTMVFIAIILGMVKNKINFNRIQ